MSFLGTDLQRELLLLINKAFRGGTSKEEIADIVNDACTRLDEIVYPEPPPEIEEDRRAR